MSIFGDFKDFYWAHREAFRMAAAGMVFVSAQLVILLWTLRRLQELSNIRERISRLADGLALLTDTTEAGFASILREIRQLGVQPKAARTSRPNVAKRVLSAARKGENVARIAEHEDLSEGEVRLHLAMSDRAKPRTPANLMNVTEFTEPPLAS